MNVLVIPEDFRKDQYILKPLVERLLRSVGRRNARVRICQDPLLGGIGEATKSERITEIVERYDRMTDVFGLCLEPGIPDEPAVKTARRRRPRGP